MSEMTPYTGRALQVSPVSGRTADRLGRRQELQRQVRQTAVEHEAELAQAKLMELGETGAAAMVTIGRLAEIRRHVELTTPEISGELSLIMGGVALGMRGVMDDLQRKLRRL